MSRALSNRQFQPRYLPAVYEKGFCRIDELSRSRHRANSLILPVPTHHGENSATIAAPRSPRHSTGRVATLCSVRNVQGVGVVYAG